MKNKKNVILSTVAGTLVVTATVSTFTLGKKKVNYMSPYNGISITTIYDQQLSDSSYEITEEDEVTIIKESTSGETNNLEKQQVDDDYDDDYYKFFFELDKVLENKNYSSEAKKTVKDSFELLYQNYDYAYSVYKGSKVPTKMEFLNNLKDTLKKDVEEIVISEEYTIPNYSYFDSKIFLPVNCDLPVLFAHELTHATQKENLLSFNENNPIYDNFGAKKIFLEGESNLITTGCYDTIKNLGIVEYRKNMNDREFLKLYGRTTDSRYNLTYKINSMLLHIAGYEKMKNMEEKFSLDDFNIIISEKYGIDGTKFINDCESLVENAYRMQNENEYDKLEYIDNFFLQCLEKETCKLNSEEDVENFYNFYRNYKLQDQVRYVMPAIDGMGNLDCTEEHFNFTNIENNLYNKCLEYNVINIDTGNSKNNKKIFDATLKIYENEDMGFLLPISYCKTGYIYNEEENTITFVTKNFADVHDLINNVVSYENNVTFNNSELIPISFNTTSKVM